MHTKRPLAPKLLNKLDDYLLLRQPETWSARTHLVLYYGLLFMAVLAGLCFIVPNDARGSTPIGYWIGFTSIISIIAIIGWMIFLLRFNVFKRFGNITALGRLRTFFLYAFSIATILLFIYVPPAVESIRANIAYGDNEIVNDINAINTKLCQLEYDSLQHDWNRDTFLVVNKIQTEAERYNGDTMIPVTHSVYKVIDTAEFNKRKKGLDSMVKIGDNLYEQYECPNYNFLKPSGYGFFNYEPFESKGILSNVNLFDNVLRNYKKPDKALVSKELQVLLSKYRYEPNEHGYEYESDYNSNPSFVDRMLKNYKIRSVETSFEHIINRKFYFNQKNWAWQIRFLVYFTLGITLLVFIFRHSTTKTFFLSLLAAVLLTIVSSITLAFTTGRSESGVFVWGIFYAVLFAAISFTVFASRKRTVIAGISINLFVLMVTFIPLIIVSYYYSLIRWGSYYDTTQLTYVPFDYAAMYRNIFIAEIAGFILLIILLPTLIHKLYRRWYSLPQE